MANLGVGYWLLPIGFGLQIYGNTPKRKTAPPSTTLRTWDGLKIVLSLISFYLQPGLIYLHIILNAPQKMQ